MTRLTELELVVRSISFTKTVLEKCDLIIKKRLIPGINNRSGLVEYALRKVFKEVFKDADPLFPSPNPSSLENEKLKGAK